jgi:hypothetical protein
LPKFQELVDNVWAFAVRTVEKRIAKESSTCGRVPVFNLMIIDLTQGAPLSSVAE